MHSLFHDLKVVAIKSSGKLSKSFYMLREEMKRELKDKIKSTKDEHILEEIYSMLELGAKEVDRIILSDNQTSALHSKKLNSLFNVLKSRKE